MHGNPPFELARKKTKKRKNAKRRLPVTLATFTARLSHDSVHDCILRTLAVFFFLEARLRPARRAARASFPKKRRNQKIAKRLLFGTLELHSLLD